MALYIYIYICSSCTYFNHCMDFEERRREQEMKFMRYTAGCTKWDYKRNDDVLKELRLEPVIKYIQEYQNKWMNHLRRTSSDRIPKAMRRSRWSHGYHTRHWIRGSRVQTRGRWIFQSVKTLSMTSFGREVKSWVPCRRFTVRKRTSSRN